MITFQLIGCSQKIDDTVNENLELNTTQEVGSNNQTKFEASDENIDRLFQISKNEILNDIQEVFTIPKGKISNKPFSNSFLPNYNFRSITYNSQNDLVNIVYYDHQNLSNSLVHIVKWGVFDSDINTPQGGGLSQKYEIEYEHVGLVNLSTDLDNQKVKIDFDYYDQYFNQIQDKSIVVRYIGDTTVEKDSTVVFIVDIANLDNLDNFNLYGSDDSPDENIETTLSKIYVNILNKDSSKVLNNI